MSLAVRLKALESEGDSCEYRPQQCYWRSLLNTMARSCDLTPSPCHLKVASK